MKKTGPLRYEWAVQNSAGDAEGVFFDAESANTYRDALNARQAAGAPFSTRKATDADQECAP